jgi:hypothetical protein
MENSTNINDILQAWSFSGVQQLDITSAVVNFLICMIMAFVLRRFYISRSFSLTGKSHIGSIIPILSGVVFLVIIVVKSSLALSLGLVGALSIVRFRTPVKEPEELVYLFLAIAIGLGYAAGHVIITTIIVTLIMIMIYFWLSNRNITKTIEYNMVITWSHKDVNFNDVVNSLTDYVNSVKLIRLDHHASDNTAVLLISPHESYTPDGLIRDLKELDSALKVSFYEAKTNW